MHKGKPQHSGVSSRTGMQHVRAFGVLYMAAVLVLYADGAFADDAEKVVREAVSSIVDVITDPAYSTTENSRARYTKLRSIADTVFAWREMARRSLGYHWRSLNPEQRSEFMETFSEYLAKVYLEKIDDYLKDRPDFSAENITYVVEKVEGRYALIKSSIHREATSQHVDYKLIKKNDAWLVYDVIIEGVGLVANYRAQFNEILGRSSVQELLHKLKDKLEHYDD